MYQFTQKYEAAKTIFNIDDNQKCFLSSKSVYYYDFWRSCDTEDWSNDAENTALITEINYIITDLHRNQLFWFVVIFYNITVFFFHGFCANKFSLFEQKNI